MSSAANCLGHRAKVADDLGNVFPHGERVSISVQDGLSLKNSSRTVLGACSAVTARIALRAMNANAADWTQIEPPLDDAMHALDDTGRNAAVGGGDFVSAQPQTWRAPARRVIVSVTTA
jgi:hypothetical protein